MKNYIIGGLIFLGVGLQSSIALSESADGKKGGFMSCFMDEKPQRQERSEDKSDNGGFDISHFNNKFKDRMKDMYSRHNSALSKMKKADQNKDGLISKEEMKAYCGSNFQEKNQTMRKNKSN